MSNKKVSVLNTRDRYYNGGKKGQTILVPEHEVQSYLSVGFVLVGGDQPEAVVEKNNVVTLTVKQIKEKLDHLGVEYDPKTKKADLLALLEKAEAPEDTTTPTDLTEVKKVLLENEVVTEDELADMEDAEIIEIATENGFTV